MPDKRALAQSTLLLSLLAMAALLSLSIVGAADITVDAGCTLADAIEAANSDTAAGGCAAGSDADTITLTGNITLAAKLPAISSEIAIAGANHTISGADKFNIFEVLDGTLNVSNLTMIAGKARYGGAIFGNNANLTVTDSALRGNRAEVSGGAIAAQRGTLTVSRSTFEDNVAMGAAAAILILEARTSISDSAFSNNQAYFNGAIGNQGGEVKITNSAFRDNSAELDGGAIGGEDAPMTIIGSQFSANRAKTNGGAISYGTAAITIQDSVFNENFAQEYGGAIYVKEADLVISASAMRDNKADEAGGAIGLIGGTALISDSEIRGNQAEAAGAIVSENGTVTVERSNLQQNSASIAGAIWGFGGKLAVHKSVLGQNSSTSTAGAILGMNNAALDIRKSWFVANEAVDMGGAIALGEAEATISGSSFSDNVAGYGGALADFSSPAAYIINNSTFNGNRAKGYGGALNLFLASTADVTHVTMAQNTADRGHSIIVYDDATIRLRNSIVAGQWGQCAGTLTENVNNLVSDGSCATTLDGDPMLGDLVEPADGSPPYYPLKPGSPMINAALADFCSEQDQIGTDRPQSSSCDIGAIEYDPAIPEGECRITTTHALRFRESPLGSVIGNVPEGSAHSAIDYAEGWYQIDHNNALGWISAEYVIAEGDCAVVRSAP